MCVAGLLEGRGRDRFLDFLDFGNWGGAAAAGIETNPFRGGKWGVTDSSDSCFFGGTREWPGVDETKPILCGRASRRIGARDRFLDFLDFGDWGGERWQRLSKRTHFVGRSGA